MADQAEGAGGEGRKAVFDEGFEALLDHHLGQHGVAGLFQAEDELLADGGGLEEGVCQKLFSTR